GGAAGAAAWLDRGRALAWLTPRDRDARAPADAFGRALALAPSLPALLAAADVAASDDERRRLLEQALALRSGGRELGPGWRALLLTRLGELARTERRDTRAQEQ